MENIIAKNIVCCKFLYRIFFEIFFNVQFFIMNSFMKTVHLVVLYHFFSQSIFHFSALFHISLNWKRRYLILHTHWTVLTCFSLQNECKLSSIYIGCTTVPDVPYHTLSGTSLCLHEVFLSGCQEAACLELTLTMQHQNGD